MKIYKFRSFLLNTLERRLAKNGSVIDLTPKEFDVLQILVERSGELVSRDEFFGRVWEGSLVEEGNLSVHISKLRKLLGESREGRFIETVPGNGYRFVAQVEIENGYNLDRDLNGSQATRLFLKGRYFLEKRTVADLQKAISCLKESIAYDPLNIYAYIELVNSYSSQFSLDQCSHSEVLNARKSVSGLRFFRRLSPKHSSVTTADR